MMPADERARRDRRADRRAPDRDRAADLRPAVFRADQRERGGEERRAAHALQLRGRCRARRCSRQGHRASEESVKTTTPTMKTQPAAVAVGERAGGEDQGGERERVRVHHPLQPRQARVQVVLDVRQRDVDDRDVEQEHERRRADGDERPAAVGRGRRRLQGGDLRETASTTTKRPKGRFVRGGWGGGSR